MIRPAAFFLILILVFQGCATHRPAKSISAEPQVRQLSSSDADEVRIGEQIHAAILSSFYPYTEPTVTNYVNRIGQSLAAHSERNRLPYHFTILYNNKIYATSAPGGFVYLTTGLLYFIDNESELAAVLAHEIGELQYRDPKLSRSRKILEAVTRGGAMVGPAFGQFGILAVLGLVAVNAVVEKNTLSQSARILRADKHALDYMIQAGYDPQGMIDLFYKFLNAQKQVAPYFYDYYQSRPINEERFNSLNQEFAKLPLQGKTFSTNREMYQEMTKGIREIYKYT